MLDIFSGDCLDPERRIADGSVDLGIFDPPFGIGEGEFNKHYKRDAENVIEGYKEAPPDYDQWTYSWLSEAKRVLKDDGSMYVFMGHSNLRSLLNAAHALELHEINHLIWKYNFGVYTTRKYVTSHYHVLYYSKSERVRPTFNTHCRFGSQEKDSDGGSLLYKDLEDVFCIQRDYSPGEKKNQNKLPDEIVRKLVLYSSNEGDLVCDFFMGNFTTAYTALKLGRRVTGYELNPNSYEYHMPLLSGIEPGCDLSKLRQVENVVPPNQGKRVTDGEATAICADYRAMLAGGMKKGEIAVKLQEKYGRGRFAIKNILDKWLLLQVEEL